MTCLKKALSIIFIIIALTLSPSFSSAVSGSAYESYSPNSLYTSSSENTADLSDSRPLVVDTDGICKTGEEFSKLLDCLMRGEYKDYQEYVFPVKVTQEPKDRESKTATYYLDLDNGTAFQIICGLMDNGGTVTPAKTEEIPQSISVWGFINEDRDMAGFQVCAASMVFLTQPDDDTFSTAAGIMLDLTGDSFGKFAEYGSVEYKFDFYPKAYDGKDAVFFTVRNIL